MFYANFLNNLTICGAGWWKYHPSCISHLAFKSDTQTSEIIVCNTKCFTNEWRDLSPRPFALTEAMNIIQNGANPSYGHIGFIFAAPLTVLFFKHVCCCNEIIKINWKMNKFICCNYKIILLFKCDCHLLHNVHYYETLHHS